jgi:hypothetical protein
MKIQYIVSVLLMLVSVTASALTPLQMHDVNQYIDNINIKAYRNHNTIRVAQVEQSDMDGDNIPDIAIMYVTEGSSWIMINIAVFTYQNGKFKLSDDVQLDAGDASRFTISRGVLTTNITKWGDDDPHCCPTVYVKARLVLRNGKIVDY